MDELLGFVTLVDQVSFGLVRFFVGLGFVDHAVDFIIRQARRALDRDLLLFAGALSLALTSRIPLASMLSASICGMPRRARWNAFGLNSPSLWLSLAMRRSPWKTLMVTAGWLSAAVEKTFDLPVGIVVLRSIRLVMMPPSVSIPSDNGVRPAAARL